MVSRTQRIHAGSDPAEWVPIGIDPMHQDYDGPVRWTTVNTAETLPGVLTPMTWSLCGWASDLAIRQAFQKLGVLDRAESRTPAAIERRYLGLFHGRLAINLDMFREMGDRMPGSSGDSVEAQMFALEESALGSVSGSRDRTRVLSVAAKFLPAALQATRKVSSEPERASEYWRRNTPTRPSDPLGLLEEAMGYWADVSTWHVVVTMIAQGVHGQVQQLSRASGNPGLETVLLAGGESEETHTVADLWAVSRHRLELDEFVLRHGFHGPAEGELVSRVWREDRSPLESLLSTYRQLPDSADPALTQAERRATRDRAEATLMASLAAHRRAATRALLRIGRRVTPLRETGRGNLLKVLDVARFALRAHGEALAANGQLDTTDDVFFLTFPELRALPADARELVAQRRKRRIELQEFELPERWSGRVAAVQPRPVSDQPVSGIGVSPGTAEGPVRVLTEPGDDGLEPGEILVCPITDPGWASYFLVAAGLVIDIGGPMSHGAIVAREMGIPCVINTREGSRRLRTGDRVRIDGSAGTVELLPKENPT